MSIAPSLCRCQRRSLQAQRPTSTHCFTAAMSWPPRASAQDNYADGSSRQVAPSGPHIRSKKVAPVRNRGVAGGRAMPERVGGDAAMRQSWGGAGAGERLDTSLPAVRLRATPREKRNARRTVHRALQQEA